jgi:hypothetical protein
VAGVPNDGDSGYRFETVKPNPTRGPSEVVFSLGRPGTVDILVFDVLGRETRALARDARFTAGKHSVAWDGRRTGGGAAGAGIYYVRVRTEGGQWTRPLVLMP